MFLETNIGENPSVYLCIYVFINQSMHESIPSIHPPANLVPYKLSLRWFAATLSDTFTLWLKKHKMLITTPLTVWSHRRSEACSCSALHPPNLMNAHIRLWDTVLGCQRAFRLHFVLTFNGCCGWWAKIAWWARWRRRRFGWMSRWAEMRQSEYSCRTGTGWRRLVS